MELTLGTEMLTAANLGSSSHEDTGAGMRHFETLPLAY